jgi:ATP-dependent DNA helicase RecG
MSETTQQKPERRLSTPVQFVKGVGPQRAELLERLNLRTASDLLFYFPRDYRDASQLVRISQLREHETASVFGVVEEVDLRNTGPGRCMLGALIRQENEYLRAVWFNQPWVQHRLAVGAGVLLVGEPRFSGGRWELVHPRLETVDDDETPTAGRILPIYSLTEGLNQSQMRRMVQGVLDDYRESLVEVFPVEYLAQHDLLPIREALQHIHAPEDPQRLAQARRRFIYQELFVLQLALALRRQVLSLRCNAPPLPLSAKIDARIRRLFPFSLTEDQNRAIEEITADLARTTPMNRLLHGDVGSGKTVVAEYAMLLAVAHGFQAAMMAPTEMLARQHARTLARDLSESRVRIVVLTGGLSAPERRQAEEAIASGQVDLIVGTHALLGDQLSFRRLGLVVIDEQHRFGVRQRAALRRAELDPHYLVMTATPIPRTVSMTMFGDLDLSTLREKPPGRATLHTYLGDETRREAWWDFFRRKLCEGRQGYVVAPLVEPSESSGVASAEQLLDTLARGPLKDFRLGLVHGRVSPAEREAVMTSFREGTTHVLVATSVIEVGIDVPNATLMTIEGGDRFGLAQLHQLRGRISRGVHPGYLCVFAAADSEEARQRLAAFERSNDGFELADIDFQLRGPGDLFGTRQHGLPPLRIADLNRDERVLEEARRDAQQLVASHPQLHETEFRQLHRMATHRYGRALDLADVG